MYERYVILGLLRENELFFKRTELANLDRNLFQLSNKRKKLLFKEDTVF